ncbi:MAG TPA: class I SAM-dependent methyltransferase [Acidimicrobiales bacterium]|nr:class I SAM-dependent methyltransferase [Acidimicrobiales bacterium]
MTGEQAGWFDANRRMWDERVGIHVASDFYDVEGFKAGKPAVEPFEIDELGPLGGLRLAHLQCHFGLDTLDLVRMHPGLEAVGLDFSQPAIDAATRLAAELDLGKRATFVQADVRDAAETLGAGGFDVVYTGKGALIWLPDLEPWAAECSKLVKPGGWLYLCEYHPIAWCFDQSSPTVRYDYFGTEPYVGETPGTYADRSAQTVNNLSYEWCHPLSKVVEAVIGAGFELRFLHEWDFCHSSIGDWMVKGDDGRYRWPAPGRLPLMYSLKARRKDSPTPGTP